MDYQQALAWLYGTQLHGIKLGLENTRRLLDAVGFRNEQRFVHVAGTNGKGSVCAMVDAICRAHGLRTGLFTSPHLVTFRERIRINGGMIGKAEVTRELSRLRDLVAGWEPHPTFFELTTALALMHFQNSGVEVVALETGMGGRLDATNAVTPVVSVITRIDLDHRAWLGSTIEEIAREKAGIIKPGVPVVTWRQADSVAEVIRSTAAAVGAPLHVVDKPLAGARSNLRGSHQAINAALAVEALQQGGVCVAPDAVRDGLAGVRWPGRFQIVDGPIVLDGAHNPSAAERLALTWREEFGDGKATVILGVLNDKDAAGVCAALAPIAARIIVTPVTSPRTVGADELAAVFGRNHPNVRCSIADSLSAALELGRLESHSVLVTGSLFLVGEALRLLTGAEGDDQPTSQ